MLCSLQQRVTVIDAQGVKIIVRHQIGQCCYRRKGMAAKVHHIDTGMDEGQGYVEVRQYDR